MGYFAVLSDTESKDARVTRCHLNLWSLPSIVPARRLFYLDVGIEVQALESDVVALQLLLPFRVETGPWKDGGNVVQDLYGAVADDDIAPLIFGGPVDQRSHGNGRALSIGDYDDDLNLIRIQPGEVEPMGPPNERSDSSLYRVPFEVTVHPKESAYIRMRWRILGASPIWRWKRLSGGARVDFRVCDVRESAFVAEERPLRSRILDISHINMFLVASPKHQLVTQSPAFKYLRTLEPGAWSKYLSGASHFGWVKGLLVYYWQYPPPTREDPSKPLPTVNANNPFRIFLDFNRATSNAWWVQMVRTMVALALALLLLQVVGGVDLSVEAVRNIGIVDALKLLGVTSVPALFLLVGRLRTWAANRFLGPRKFFRAQERKVLDLTQRG